ncbi:MAG: hypothetical protein KatS3mg110_3719 [Pirellulaceae bacterium]|nr:MAG: hypothetical protein KatS3mg110_3719 [Pirellulaceae bacterium]
MRVRSKGFPDADNRLYAGAPTGCENYRCGTKLNIPLSSATAQKASCETARLAHQHRLQDFGLMARPSRPSGLPMTLVRTGV